MKPEELAAGLLARHGYEKAVKIVELNGREMIGTANDVPNPNRLYFLQVLGRIKNLSK